MRRGRWRRSCRAAWTSNWWCQTTAVACCATSSARARPRESAALPVATSYGPDVSRALLTIHSNRDLGATIASGSHGCGGMAIVPCSMKTLAGVAHGLSRSLVERAADVMLKERRPLVIVPRETPMSLPQLKNMVLCAEAGAMMLRRCRRSTSCRRRSTTWRISWPARFSSALGFDHDLYPPWTGQGVTGAPDRVCRAHRRHVRCDCRPLRLPQPRLERRHRPVLATTRDRRAPPDRKRARARCVHRDGGPRDRAADRCAVGRSGRRRRLFGRHAARRPRETVAGAASTATIALVRGDAMQIPAADRSVDAVDHRLRHPQRRTP